MSSGTLQPPIFYDLTGPHKVFGHAVSSSRKFWRNISKSSGMLRHVGTLEIALEDKMIQVIEKHKGWNSSYCPEDRMKLLSQEEVLRIELELKASSALLL
ncbi:MAG: hypothetical protein QW837_08780 [Conexivisphaerales archaeon]